MTHALGVRATLFACSTALLGTAMFAALTMTISLRAALTPEGPPVVPVVDVAPVEPPPPQTIHTAPPQSLAPLDASSPATNTIMDPLAPPIAAVWAPPGPVEISAPQWLQRPRDLARYYPARALARGIEGSVVLDCRVSAAGALSCSVTDETPPNWGFAAAALRIAADHRMAPATRDGVAVEGRYRMRVPFAVNDR